MGHPLSDPPSYYLLPDPPSVIGLSHSLCYRTKKIADIFLFLFLHLRGIYPTIELDEPNDSNKRNEPMTTINQGTDLLRDALANGFDNVGSFLYAGAAIVTLLAALMVRNALNTAKYRR